MHQGLHSRECGNAHPALPCLNPAKTLDHNSQEISGCGQGFSRL